MTIRHTLVSDQRRDRLIALARGYAQETAIEAERCNETGAGNLELIEALRNGGYLAAPIPVVSSKQAETFLEPFVRGRGRLAGTRDRPGGHGLGLTLVAKIVEVHEGNLDLHANPEGGLTVRVVLPAP